MRKEELGRGMEEFGLGEWNHERDERHEKRKGDGGNSEF